MVTVRNRHGKDIGVKISGESEMFFTRKEGLLNPYIAGFMVGLVMLGSFVILGTGVGASGGIDRIAAYLSHLAVRSHSQLGRYLGTFGDLPLNHYLVFMLGGAFCGSIISALVSGRFSFEVERGGKCSVILRLTFALAGGAIVGLASRLTRGCTSGQALSGSSLLLTGSFVFLVCILAGGFITAALFRRQWDD